MRRDDPRPRVATGVEMTDRLTGAAVLDRLPVQGDLSDLGDVERLGDLLTRLSQIQDAEQNPYKRRFLNFLAKCVWTVDESRAGKAVQFPTGQGRDGKHWLPIWEELEEQYLTQELVMLEKSRRVLASWFTCAFDIWLCAGGMDPRWVNENGQRVLMESDTHRSVSLITQRAEGQAGSEWFLEERIKFILEQFEINGCREFWPDFPTWTHRADRIQFSNGSTIHALPQGPEKARGPGITFGHVEEFAFWEQAEPTISNLQMTCVGGGHLVAITTANHGTFAHRVRDDKIAREQGKGEFQEEAKAYNLRPSRLGRKLQLRPRMTSDGWVILRLHYSIIPDYNLREAKRGKSEMKWKMEGEIDWSASNAKLVFPEFGEIHISESPIEWDPYLPIVLGWDFGQTPACVLGQVAASGQLRVIKAFVGAPDVATGFYQFACDVHDYLLEEIARPNRMRVDELHLHHYGDPAGRAPQLLTRGVSSHGIEAKSFFEVLENGEEYLAGFDEHGNAIKGRRPGFGWRVEAGAVDNVTRQESVRNRLTVLVDKKPALVVSNDCEIIITAFQSGYRFRERNDGTFDDVPEKNWHSHPSDALQYICTRLTNIRLRVETEDEENENPRTEFRSHANVRR